MTAIYIDLAEQTDIDMAVIVAAHREATKIIFIGEDAKANKAASNLNVPFEHLPAGSKVPVGEGRIFAGMLTFSY